MQVTLVGALSASSMSRMCPDLTAFTWVRRKQLPFIISSSSRLDSLCILRQVITEQCVNTESLEMVQSYQRGYNYQERANGLWFFPLEQIEDAG